jgi:hypothetical protein
MAPKKSKNEPARALEPVPPSDDERLFNELNLLRLEGYYFCLDPKAASRYTQQREFIERIKSVSEILERPIRIEPNPNYGYPSIIAYKVLQACMKKLSDYGYPIAENVCFSQRELARMIGRKSFGGADSDAILQAAMQLNSTKVWCSFYDKETKEWKAGSIYIIEECLFSGKKDRLQQCVFKINSRIVRSLNQRHAFWINYQRIEGFEPITTALYKHLFYHFSNLFSQVRTPEFSFNKDYADLCTQWLGSLTVLKYKSKILKEQLGRHLQQLKECGLLDRFELAKRADGDGFAFVFHPGPGFFEDYQRFYGGGQPPLPFAKAADEKNLHQPMRVVQYFYTKLYQTDELGDFILSDKEVEQAAKLLEKHPYEEVCGFIDYALAETPKTAYDVKTFAGIKQYYPGFLAHRKTLLQAEAQERQRREEARNRHLEEQYRIFRRQRLKDLRQTLSAEELHALEKAARAHVEATHSQPIGREILVRLQAEQFLAEKHALPSLDEWKASQPDGA